jgi:hypothetical protein
LLFIECIDDGLAFGEAIIWLLLFIEWPLIMACAAGLAEGDAAAMVAAKIKLSMLLLRRNATDGLPFDKLRVTGLGRQSDRTRASG